MVVVAWFSRLDVSKEFNGERGKVGIEVKDEKNVGKIEENVEFVIAVVIVSSWKD